MSEYKKPEYSMINGNPSGSIKILNFGNREVCRYESIDGFYYLDSSTFNKYRGMISQETLEKIYSELVELNKELNQSI